MNKIKTAFAWFKTNLLTLIVVGFVGHYFLGDLIPDRPITFKEKSFNRGGYAVEESMDMMMAEPMMAKSHSIRSVAADIAESFIPPVQAAGFDPEVTDRKIIKNGNLQIEVEDTKEGRTLAEKEIEALGGLVTNGNSWEARTGILAYNLTVRVPAESFEILIENLSKLGVKKSENFSSQDITESYNDTEAQLENLETRRTRLLKLLEFETESLNDVLQVDREISNVQQQIERLNRTQNTRDGNIAYSTLQLTINPEPQIGDFSNAEWNVEKSWKVAVNDFIASAQGLLDKVIKAAVYAPFWLPLVAVYFIWRRHKKKKS